MRLFYIICTPKWGTRGTKVKVGYKAGYKVGYKCYKSDFLETLLSNFDRLRDSVEVWVRKV